MTHDEKYMLRCLQLAANGRGLVSPNPLVGSIIVHNDIIIGEGYHRQYGKAHAEVNAIDSVKDKALLKNATLYVTLEPCSHHGKTPPCARLIIDSQIKRVVIACKDPYHEVSGRGIRQLQRAGIEVVVGVLESEALTLNKEFVMSHTSKRPYVYLKWAQSADGFIDKERIDDNESVPTPISNDFTRILVHKKRAETDAIMVGTNTAILDNPSLTTRNWSGDNPLRVVLDRCLRIPHDCHVFDGKVKTIVFTQEGVYETKKKGVIFKQVLFDEFLLETILSDLSAMNVNSVMVEGGSQLLNSFIKKNLWDEAFVETSDVCFEKGIKSPSINGHVLSVSKWGSSHVLHMTQGKYKNV